MLFKNPAQSHFGKALLLLQCLGVEFLELCKEFRGEHFRFEKTSLAHTAVLRNAALQIAVGQQSLRQGREGDKTQAVVAALLKDAFLQWSLVQHVQAPLVNEGRNIPFAQVLYGRLQRMQGPSRNADVQSLARAHYVHQCL